MNENVHLQNQRRSLITVRAVGTFIQKKIVRMMRNIAQLQRMNC